MERDRNGLEVLAREECFRLLATLKVGRVALSVGGLPVVVPVNFLVVDEAMVFRTGVGSKLSRPPPATPWWPVASSPRCKSITGVGSSKASQAKEGDLHPCLREYRLWSASALRSMSCSVLTVTWLTC